MERLILSVVSPVKVLFEGEVERVTLPGTLGSFAILPGHAPIISSLEKGKITYVSAGEEQVIEVQTGGFVEKNGEQISVCIY